MKNCGTSGRQRKHGCLRWSPQLLGLRVLCIYSASYINGDDGPPMLGTGLPPQMCLFVAVSNHQWGLIRAEGGPLPCPRRPSRLFLHLKWEEMNRVCFDIMEARGTCVWNMCVWEHWSHWEPKNITFEMIKNVMFKC